MSDLGSDGWPSVDTVLATERAAHERTKARLADEAARLDYLITWLGLNDDVQQLPVRDWYSNEDARSAIDEARVADSAPTRHGSRPRRVAGAVRR